MNKPKFKVGDKVRTLAPTSCFDDFTRPIEFNPWLIGIRGLIISIDQSKFYSKYTTYKVAIRGLEDGVHYTYPEHHLSSTINILMTVGEYTAFYV